ncbi:MAG: hypothetical protein VX899_06855 [Myxococcota bacterium]|nr:hypothetical protein [Myxococcota bacterium]
MPLWIFLSLACTGETGNDTQPADTEEADADTDADTDADSDTDSDADTDVVPPGNAYWLVDTDAGTLEVALEATQGHYLECIRDGDTLEMVFSNSVQTANANAKVRIKACPYASGTQFNAPYDAGCGSATMDMSWTGDDGTWNADQDAEGLNCSVTISDDGTDYSGSFACSPMTQPIGSDGSVSVREGSFTCRMQ